MYVSLFIFVTFTRSLNYCLPLSTRHDALAAAEIVGGGAA